MQGKTPKSVCNLYVYMYMYMCLYVCVGGDQVTQPPSDDPWKLDFGHANSVTFTYSCMSVDLKLHVILAAHACMHAHGI